MFTRREFLGTVATGAVSWYFIRSWDLPDAFAAAGGGFFDSHGPIDRGLGDKAPRAFFGDSPDRAHAFLRDPQKLASLPAPKTWEEARLVVVGGGLSGLFTAYALRDRKPIVLEQAARFGGNAQGQAWRGSAFPLGSAYFPEPAPGAAFHRFYKELGISRLVQRAPENEPVAVGSQFTNGFWKGDADSANRVVYQKLIAFLDEIWDAKKQPFPDIPPQNPAGVKVLESWDTQSLQKALEARLGALPPKLQAGIEAYCLSSFGALPTEISAAAGLCFLASERAPLCVAPGGNAGIAEHLLQSCMESGVPASHLRAQSLVTRVAVEKDRVRVSYVDSSGQTRGVVAQAAVMACPKFVVARILEGIEPARIEAIRQISYRAYLTAAVLLDQPLSKRFYDLFLVDADRKFTTPTGPAATDAVVGTFGQSRSRHTALTLYRALPQPAARGWLLGAEAYESARREFEKQIEGQLFPALGLKKQNLVDIRVARWGHALPVPFVGCFASGLPAKLNAVFAQRVFFIHQDSWLTPALESGVGELTRQEQALRALTTNTSLARGSR